MFHKEYHGDARDRLSLREDHEDLQGDLGGPQDLHGDAPRIPAPRVASTLQKVLVQYIPAPRGDITIQKVLVRSTILPVHYP